MDRLNRGLFALRRTTPGRPRCGGCGRRRRRWASNPNVWFNNVELVAGEISGRETVEYVSNIYKYYTAYKAMVAHLELRSKRRRILQ